MKKHDFKIFPNIFLLIVAILSFSDAVAQSKKNNELQQTDTLYINYDQGQMKFELKFLKGKSHNHPTFAIWLEDDKGAYLETIFVTEYISSGIYGYADAGDGSWKNEKGEALRPAALPYWSHKRNVISRDSLFIPTPENPVTDAISSATPKGNFVLRTSTASDLPDSFNILLEINQPWDWNEYWTNTKYNDDKDYKTSSQPSIIYAGEIESTGTTDKIRLKPIGHGHYSGKDGKLYTDISTFTTALEIADEITVTITK
jgi:hypothetical protein